MSKGGLYNWVDEFGRVTEKKTYTCCHCNTIHQVPPEGSEQMGFCKKCFARECIDCAIRLQGRCTPFEQRIEAYEAKQRLLEAIGVGG